MTSNAQITTVSAQRFNFDESFVTPRSKEREQRRLNRQVVQVYAPKKPAQPTPLTEEEAEAWALELDALHANCNAADAAKMTEEYNRWHTLDDHLDYGALLRGIHNIQERGGNSGDEERFCNAVCDRFGHERLQFGN